MATAMPGTVIISGGGQGIGRATARRLLSKGWRVVVAERDREAGEEVVLDVNLTGPFLCAKHAAPFLRRAGGAMVNIASTRALMSEPHTEAYSASTGGLVALTHALALSLGPVVRVNCISPGWIETGDWKKAARRVVPSHSRRDREQHPVGRVGRPEDGL